MNRAEWLELRRKNQISPQAFYEYYKDCVEPEKVKPEEEFMAGLEQFFAGRDIQPDIQAATKHLDKKFNILLLADREGKVLNIY